MFRMKNNSCYFFIKNWMSTTSFIEKIWAKRAPFIQRTVDELLSIIKPQLALHRFEFLSRNLNVERNTSTAAS